MQHVVPQVYEHFCQVIAAFHIKCVDKRGRDKQRSIGRSAIRFDAACNIHCIANYREFRSSITANIAPDDWRIVNADGNADRAVI